MSVFDDVSFSWQDLLNQFAGDINLGDLAEDFKTKYNEKVENMGYVNIIVAGRTGAGKSTLINAAFRENVAETGIGDPVTSKIRLIQRAGVPVRIYDTVGLELNEDTQKASIAEIQSLVAEKVKKGVNEMIHLIWYCVSVESERFEGVEASFVENIASSGVPTLIVATKAFDKELTDEFVSNLSNRNLPIKKIVPVLARNKLDYKAYGIDELVEYSVSLLPEAVQAAWINAINSVRLKSKRAQIIVQATVTANFVVGFIPIPFADAGVLAAAEVTMLVSIAVVYGAKLEKNEIISFLSTIAGVGGASVLGRTIVSNLLKLLPGAGTVIGGAISGLTAAILTFAIGETFIVAMNMVAAGKISKDQFDSKEAKKEIRKVFKEKIKIGLKKFKNGIPSSE